MLPFSRGLVADKIYRPAVEDRRLLACPVLTVRAKAALVRPELTSHRPEISK